MKKLIYSMLALFCAAFAFTSCEDVPMPYDQPGEGGEDAVIIQPTGEGTADNPFNVAAALEYVNNLAADEKSEGNIYIKGKVSSINTNYDESGTFGNAVFYISDDGTGKNTFYVYRALYLGNKKYSSGETLNEGDEVIICGKVVNYKGTTPETVQSEAFLYSLNGKTAGGGGDTPVGKEVTCAEAVELTNALDDNATSSDVYSITGYITEVVGSVSKNQQTFWMADTKDGGRVFEAYWANLPEGVSEFKKGSKVKITGNLMKYVKDGKVTPEIKNADVVILEEGGGEDPQPGGDVKVVTIADFNAAAESTDVWYQLTGTVKNLKNGDQYGNFDLEDATGSVYVYGLLSEKGGEKKKFQDLVAAKGIQEGSTITIIGNRGSYNGKIEVMNAYFVSIGEGGGGGGETPAGNVTKTVDGAVVTLVVAGATEGNKVTVDLNAQGWESGKAVDPATITLEDGTKITFAKGEGSNTPAYYEATKGVRVYAKNTITISGKAVAKVVLNCDTYNNTNYTGNSTLYGSASGTTFTICNEHSEAKGGDQLRVQTIEITYAQ